MFKRLLAVLAVISLASCAGRGEFDMPPEVSLVNLVPAEAGLFEQRVAATLRIRNPNDATLPIDGFRFAIEVNGRPFATGFSDARVDVPRLSEATTTATATVSTIDFLRQILHAPGSDKLEYRLTGTAFVPSGAGRVQMPFEQSGGLDFKAETTR